MEGTSRLVRQTSAPGATPSGKSPVSPTSSPPVHKWDRPYKTRILFFGMWRSYRTHLWLHGVCKRATRLSCHSQLHRLLLDVLG